MYRCIYCKNTDHLGIDCPKRDPQAYEEDVFRRWDERMAEIQREEKEQREKDKNK